MFSRKLLPLPFGRRGSTSHDASQDRALIIFSSTVRHQGEHADHIIQDDSSVADQSPPAPVQRDLTYVL